jgi:hypothetical protein
VTITEISHALRLDRKPVRRCAIAETVGELIPMHQLPGRACSIRSCPTCISAGLTACAAPSGCTRKLRARGCTGCARTPAPGHRRSPATASTCPREGRPLVPHPAGRPHPRQAGTDHRTVRRTRTQTSPIRSGGAGQGRQLMTFSYGHQTRRTPCHEPCFKQTSWSGFRLSPLANRSLRRSHLQ